MSVETVTPEVAPKESNEDRREKKLKAVIEKNHRWRLSTWGKATRKIEEAQRELETMGRQQVDLVVPDLDDPVIVSELAEL